MSDKKNCHNCEYLEYVIGDVGDPEGFTCNKRLTGGESQKVERDLLKKLDRESYRMKSKVCFEPMQAGPDGEETATA